MAVKEISRMLGKAVEDTKMLREGQETAPDEAANTPADVADGEEGSRLAEKRVERIRLLSWQRTPGEESMR